MIDQRLCASLFSKLMISPFIFLSLKSLKEWIEHRLFSLDLLMSHMFDCLHALSKGFLCSLSFFVLMHLCFPGVQVLLAFLQNHLSFNNKTIS